MSAAAFFQKLNTVNNEVAAYERKTREIEMLDRQALLTDQAARIAAQFTITPAADHMRIENTAVTGDWALIYRKIGTNDVDRSRTELGPAATFEARAFEIVIEERVAANKAERLATGRRAA